MGENEIDQHQYTRKLDAILEALKNGDGCGAKAEIVKEHTESISYLKNELPHVVKALERIEKKLDDGNRTFDDHTKRLTILETQKSTSVAVGVSILGALWSALTWYINVKGGK